MMEFSQWELIQVIASDGVFFSESLLGSLQGIEFFSVGAYSSHCKWLSFFSGSLFKSLQVAEFFQWELIHFK